MTGADSPRVAVERFLAAARATDMQEISALFGSDAGPLRDRTDRPTLERQELIMIACLKHDQATIAAPLRGENGRLVLATELKQAARTASPKFTVVRGPSNRWYVESFEITVLQNKGFCGKA